MFLCSIWARNFTKNLHKKACQTCKFLVLFSWTYIPLSFNAIYQMMPLDKLIITIEQVALFKFSKLCVGDIMWCCIISIALADVFLLQFCLHVVIYWSNLIRVNAEILMKSRSMLWVSADLHVLMMSHLEGVFRVDLNQGDNWWLTRFSWKIAIKMIFWCAAS